MSAVWELTTVMTMLCVSTTMFHSVANVYLVSMEPEPMELALVILIKIL